MRDHTQNAVPTYGIGARRQNRRAPIIRTNLTASRIRARAIAARIAAEQSGKPIR